MSSILIKGVMMPKNCWDCKLTVAVAEQGARCPFTERVITKDEFDMYSGIHPDCPLVEVPEPHGRLIDEDMLNESLDAHRAAIGDGNVADAIDETPTVIEAEE